MLQDKSLQADLFNLIFNKNTSDAMDLIHSNAVQNSRAQVDYFFNFYQNPIYKTSYFEFWKAIINLNFDQPPLSIKLKLFVEKSCLRAIYLKDYDFIFLSLQNSKTREFILKSLAQNDYNCDFTLSLLSNPDLSHFAPTLLALSIQFFNAVLARQLLVIHTLPPSLNDDEKSILCDFNMLEPHKAHFMHVEMRRFAQGMGYIKHQDILLTLAQIKSRKKYVFQPIAVSDNEFDNFFQYVKTASAPRANKFIVTGEHSYCGEILLDDSDKACVYIIDSLGSSFESEDFHEQFISKLMEYFQDIQIYINQEVRQLATKGCSIFALDDLHHLHNLRLPQGYKDIWDYLNKNAIPDPNILENLDILIHKYPLPTPLLRTMQTRNLLEKVIPERLEWEPEYPINKKGQSILQSTHTFFKQNENGKTINMRLMYQLEKIRYNNWEFLKKCRPEELETLKSQFTIQAQQPNYTRPRFG